VELFVEIYERITEAIYDLLGYLEEVLYFVDDFSGILEDFFSSAFDDMKNLASSLNPKEVIWIWSKSLRDLGVTSILGCLVNQINISSLLNESYH
jgi:hypothetical protein